MDKSNASDLRFSDNYGFVGFVSSSSPSYPSVDYGFTQFVTSFGLNTQSSWH